MSSFSGRPSTHFPGILIKKKANIGNFGLKESNIATLAPHSLNLAKRITINRRLVDQINSLANGDRYIMICRTKILMFLFFAS